MPYITQQNRIKFIDVLAEFGKLQKLSAGEMNYLITTLLLMNASNGTINYGAINEAIGVLECAKFELYRRLASPYEDEKIKENGDVFCFTDKQTNKDSN